MKYTIILLSIFFCLVAVSGRNLRDADLEESDDGEEAPHHGSERTLGQSRHRRRSRQSYFDYNYPSYDYRRDNIRQEELLAQILKLTDEIYSHLRRAPPTPPQPQPIYIPYPVPYPVPQYIPCRYPQTGKPGNTTFIPNLNNRWPDLEDPNQNWGLIPDENDDTAGGGDGSRPISFDPVPPKRPNRVTPPVDHGSEQAGMETTTHVPVKKPGQCQAAILSCCNSDAEATIKKCFDLYGCPKTYNSGVACTPRVLKRVIDEFTKVYSPRDSS